MTADKLGFGAAVTVPLSSRRSSGSSSICSDTEYVDDESELSLSFGEEYMVASSEDEDEEDHYIMSAVPSLSFSASLLLSRPSADVANTLPCSLAAQAARCKRIVDDRYLLYPQKSMIKNETACILDENAVKQFQHSYLYPAMPQQGTDLLSIFAPARHGVSGDMANNIAQWCEGYSATKGDAIEFLRERLRRKILDDRNIEKCQRRMKREQSASSPQTLMNSEVNVSLEIPGASKRIRKNRHKKTTFSAFHDTRRPPLRRSLSLTLSPGEEFTIEDYINEVTDMWLKEETTRRTAQHSPSGRYNVIVQGTGPEAVILIHGICMSSNFWTDGLMKYISPQTLKQFTFYLPDLLGYGRNANVDPYDNYSRTEQAGMVIRDVIQGYGLRSYHLVGHSYGALVCADLASRAPEVVKTVTLFAPAYFESEHQAFSSLTKIPFPVRQIVALPELGGVMIRFLNFIRPYLAPLANKIIPASELPRAAVWDFFAINPDATLGTIYSIIHERIDPCLQVLNKNNVNILVVHGNNDGVVAYRQGQMLSNRYPNIMLRTLPGLVHHFPTSHARIAADILEHQLLHYLSSRKTNMVSCATCIAYPALPRFMPNPQCRARQE